MAPEGKVSHHKLLLIFISCWGLSPLNRRSVSIPSKQLLGLLASRLVITDSHAWARAYVWVDICLCVRGTERKVDLNTTFFIQTYAGGVIPARLNMTARGPEPRMAISETEKVVFVVAVFYQVRGDFSEGWLVPQTRLLMFHLFLNGHCRWLTSKRESPAGGIVRNIFLLLINTTPNAQITNTVDMANKEINLWKNHG